MPCSSIGLEISESPVPDDPGRDRRRCTPPRRHGMRPIGRSSSISTTVWWQQVPSAVFLLNRAVAIRGEGQGGEDAGGTKELTGYHSYHAAMGELLRRAGRTVEATAALTLAAELTSNPAERRFLEARLASLHDACMKSGRLWNRGLIRSLRAALEAITMKNRLTKGFLASALALSLALVACDTDNPDDGGSSTTAPAGTETTTTLAGSSTTSP